MSNIASNMKQKLSLVQKYKIYLRKGPNPESKLYNRYNIFDDLNITDKAIMKEVKRYMGAMHGLDKAGTK